jgi:hypothetical protein
MYSMTWDQLPSYSSVLKDVLTLYSVLGGTKISGADIRDQNGELSYESET